MIGHTQPRRIAARSVSARIASELGPGLGRLVGYQVRFQRHTARNTRIKVMTDGILLAEIQGDRDLRAYDTLIIDEAHERTLNVDFVLGYLRHLVQRRPDLRVVVASATLEVEKLRAFFDRAPVIEVEGRTHPIEIRYRPGEEGDDVPERVAGALEELRDEPGDVLVFLSGGTRDPGDRGSGAATRIAGHRALSPPRPHVGGAPAGAVHAGRTPPGGACDERRGDLAHGARHPLRHRCGHCPCEPVRTPYRACSGCRWNRSRGPRPTSAPVAAGGWVPGCASGSTTRRSSRPGPPGRSPRSGAPTSRRCCCACCRWACRKWSASRSSTPRPAPRQRRPAAAARTRGHRRRRRSHEGRAPARAAAARPQDRAHAARSGRARLRRRRAGHRELPERARSP